jgi:hypothetical protein
MTNSRHTPGPLKAVKPIFHNPSSTRHIVDAKGNLVGRVDFANAHQSENEAIANAELFAASPKLLEALESIIRIAQLRDDNKTRPEGLFELLRDAEGTARAAITAIGKEAA